MGAVPVHSIVPRSWNCTEAIELLELKNVSM